MLRIINVDKENLRFIANSKNNANNPKSYKNNSCQELVFNSQYKKPANALAGCKEPKC